MLFLYQMPPNFQKIVPSLPMMQYKSVKFTESRD